MTRNPAFTYTHTRIHTQKSTHIIYKKHENRHVRIDKEERNRGKRCCHDKSQLVKQKGYLVQPNRLVKRGLEKCVVEQDEARIGRGIGKGFGLDILFYFGELLFSLVYWLYLAVSTWF